MEVCSRGGRGLRSRRHKRQGEGWGGGIPLPIQLRNLGERRELPSGVQGRTPVKKIGAFYLSVGRRKTQSVY